MIKMGFNKGFVNDKCKKEHNKKFKCLFMGMKKIAVVNLAAAGAMITIPGLFSDCNVMANQKVKLSIGKNKLVNKSKYGYLQVATQGKSNSQGYRSVNSRKMTAAYHLPSSYGCDITPLQEKILMKGLALDYKKRYKDIAELKNSFFPETLSETLFFIIIGKELSQI